LCYEEELFLRRKSNENSKDFGDFNFSPEHDGLSDHGYGAGPIGHSLYLPGFPHRQGQASNADVQQGDTVDINDCDIIDGYFTVELDFGDGIFTGEARWLETAVRQGNSSDPCDFITLEPRLELTLSPYAVYAKTVGTVPETIASAVVPKGGIIMWSGSIASIPGGWALCDGTNTTPDLTSKFIKSVPDNLTDPGLAGGSTTHDHGSGSYTAAAHTHTYSGTTNQPPSCGEWAGDAGCIATGKHTHTYSGTTDPGGGGSISGTSGEGSSLPPYYELAFIMKL